MTLFQFINKKWKLSQTKEAIAKNLLWSLLGKVTSLLGGLLVGIIVARYLGPAKYGLMSYVISYVLLFQTFAVLGLDSIEIREESKGTEPFQKIIGTAFGLRIISAIFFMALVIGTSWFMDADWQTTGLIVIYSFTIILNSFNVIRNYFTAIVQNEYVVKAEISRTLIGVTIKVTLLLLHASLTWFVAAAMFDMVLLASGYCMAYGTKIGSIRQWYFDRQYARYMLKESIPLMVSGAAIILYQRVDQVMIGQLIDKESVGYFSVAAKFVEILIYIPMVLSQTIMPVLVNIRERSETDYIVKGQTFMNISLWLTLLLSGITSLLAYWIVIITFGHAYEPSVAVLQILSFKAASLALSNTAGTMIVAEGLQKYTAIRDTLGCIVCICLNYLFLPAYGITAAAWIAIFSNVAAGYVADLLIPSYHHIFRRQTKALFLGWKDLLSVKELFVNTKK